MPASLTTNLVAIEYLKKDVARLESLFLASVDDMKAFIRSEIADLKTEQISDLKKENGSLEVRLQAIERYHESIKRGTSVLGWVVKTLIALVSAFGGAVGWEHLKGH